MSDASLRAALRLMVILDPSAAAGRDLRAIASQAASGGATMLQVRAKSLSSAAIAELTRDIIAAADAVPVIVNDRLDIALATGAAGCHLGPDDMPVATARALAPAGFLLGASAGTAPEARDAQAQGADYIGIGPIRVTASKADAGGAIGPDGFRRVREAANLPAIAIGGITAADVPALLKAGADGVAVISAVLSASDPRKAVEALKRSIVEAA